MFGRRKGQDEERVSGRYVVEHFASGKGMVNPEVYSAGLQDLLNRGDAKGWRLVHMGGAGSSGAMMVVWDTSEAK